MRSNRQLPRLGSDLEFPFIEADFPTPQASWDANQDPLSAECTFLEALGDLPRAANREPADASADDRPEVVPGAGASAQPAASASTWTLVGAAP